MYYSGYRLDNDPVHENGRLGGNEGSRRSHDYYYIVEICADCNTFFGGHKQLKETAAAVGGKIVKCVSVH